MPSNHIEIERRFLLKNNNWRKEVTETQVLHQGYLSVEKERTIRVRILNQQAWLTIKGYISEISRSEFEYEIPRSDAQYILQNICPFKIEKHRHKIRYGEFTFEIDEFIGENAPLIIAELELSSEQTQYPIPEWLGEEITTDERFTNAYLSTHPYSQWQK